MKKVSAFAAIFLFVMFSCTKEELNKQPATTHNMDVPSDFNWSAYTTYPLKVDVSGNENSKTIRLLDLQGHLIDAQSIENSSVRFHIQTPYPLDTFRLYDPLSRLSKYVTTDVTQTDFHLGGTSKRNEKATDYALSLDGENGYVAINNGGNGGIVMEYPFTFSAWFKTPGAGPEDDDMVLVSLSDPDWASVYFGVHLRQFRDFYKAQITSRVGSKTYRKSTNQNVSDDTWHQIVGVFTADGKRKLYLNGVYEGMSSSVLDFDPGAVVLNFGRWGDNTPNNYYHGLIDNVCVWDKALTEQEVQQYYTNSPTGGEEGLAGFYTFDGGSGNSVINMAAPGFYDGTLMEGVARENTSEMIDGDGDGVPDDSDHWPDDEEKAYLSVYPAGDDYYFQLFEDLWPGLGDYDFNDVILRTKLHLYKNAQNTLIGGRVKSKVYWIGGGVPRGAGIEFFKSNEEGTQFTYLPQNNITFSEAENVSLDNSVPNAVTLFDGEIINSLGGEVDFEFARENAEAGNILGMQVYIYRDRTHEIHMFGLPPTNVADMSLFRTDDDASPASWSWEAGRNFSENEGFYKTNNNLPWGIEIVAEEFYVPNEGTDMTIAYPQFRAWAESGGSKNQDWYKHPSQSDAHLPD
ncbi:MAG TPA: LruC domain-containing protein [Bacteroidales bacterium]|nr:LruC domain-containing protein [Bacteroidales bacterium]